MKINMIKFQDTFTSAYIEALLWSSSVCTDHDSVEYTSADEYDYSNSLELASRIDCVDFIQSNIDLLKQQVTALQSTGYTEEQSIELTGHDFALTRNGHGAGYWDRGTGVIGTELTELAKSYGSIDLYLDDDNKVSIC